MKTVSKLGIVAGVVALTLSGFVVNAQSNNTKSNTAELPATAQSFIKENFGALTIESVTAEKEATGTEYDVVLSGGTSIEFDENGNWEEIDSKVTALPASVIPGAIAEYTAKNHAGNAIMQIEKDKNGFDVELVDNTDLEFDANGKFVRIDK